MQIEEFAKIDLNLLLVFHILMQERSVTRAADRLNMTQSGMSKALSRLRNTFNDPVFISTPGGLEPTAKSIKVSRQVSEILDKLLELYLVDEFHPEHLDMAINVAVPDLVAAVLGPELFNVFVQQSPKLRFRLLPYDGQSIAQLSKGELDLVIGAVPERPPARIYSKRILTSKGAFFVAEDHPLTRKQQVTLDDILAYPHVKPWFKGVNNQALLDILLDSQGKKRQVAIESSGFLTMLKIIEQSEGVLYSDREMNFIIEKFRIVQILPVEPLDLLNKEVHLIWDQRSQQDPIFRWIRQTVYDGVTKALSGAQHEHV